MFKSYGLREQPFGVTPNPKYFYASAVHRKALASLVLGMEYQVGFAALISEPGLGKTTLLFDLLERYRTSAQTAFIFNTQCTANELMRCLVQELQIKTVENDLVQMHADFRLFLANQSRSKPVLIVIDEAQNLEDSVLESLRLLSDFETSNRKLLHIILSGQPQLATRLSRPELAQLLQRITIISRLQPLSPNEVGEYIQYRLKVAGYSGPPLFSSQVLAKIVEYSGGIPRSINRICFNTLLLGEALHKPVLDGDIVEQVVRDLELQSPHCPEIASPFPELRSPAESKQVHAEAPASLARPVIVPVNDTSSLVSPPQQVIAPAALQHQRQAVASQLKPLAVTASASQKPRDGVRTFRLNSKRRVPVMISVAAAVIAGLLLLGGEVRSRVSGEHTMQPATAPIPVTTPTPAPVDVTAAGQKPPDVVPAVPDMRSTQPVTPSLAASKSSASAGSSRSTKKTKPQPSVRATPGGSKPRQVMASASARASTISLISRKPALPIATRPIATSGGGASASEKPFSDRLKLTVMSGAERNNDNPRGELIQMVQPSYPSAARAAGIQGAVSMNVTVSKEGAVEKVGVTSGDPLLAKTAEDAVRQWRYRPYYRNGQPVPVDLNVTIEFLLTDKNQ